MRKAIKYIALLTGVLLLGILIVYLTLMYQNRSFIGPSNKEFVEYLIDNKTVLGKNTFFEHSGHILNRESYTSDIILLGESQGIADVQELDKSLFLHFNKSKGTRYYLAEIDSLGASMLNSYLADASKDSTLLKEYVKRVRQFTPQQESRELYDKWSEIYDYNTSLPDTAKFTVIGLADTLDDTSDMAQSSVMMSNFTKTIEELQLQNESFYGFLGLFHVLQNGINVGEVRDHKTFGSRLIAQGFSVTSIACLDIDSETYVPANDKYPAYLNGQTKLLSMDGPILLVKGINDLKKATYKNSNVLFYLDRLNSPYHRSLKLTTLKTNFFDGEFSAFDKLASTTDFFQYVVFLRNAKANTPLNESN